VRTRSSSTAASSLRRPTLALSAPFSRFTCEGSAIKKNRGEGVTLFQDMYKIYPFL
jgi:hypothetical protein